MTVGSVVAVGNPVGLMLATDADAMALGTGPDRIAERVGTGLHAASDKNNAATAAVNLIIEPGTAGKASVLRPSQSACGNVIRLGTGRSPTAYGARLRATGY